MTQHTRTRVVTGLLVAFLGAALPGCGPGDAAARAPSTAAGKAWPVLVDPAWLTAPEQQGLIVIDTRSPDLYAAGHVPGAVNIPRAATYGTEAGTQDDAAPIARIEEVFGSAGVSHASPVVLYDDKNYRDAARVFWVLEVHGHQRVSVLNGGLAGWKSAGLPVTTEPTVRRPTRFIANLQPGRLVTKLQVRQAIGDDRLLLLDARAPDEFTGQRSKTDRAGHIPTAVNVDFASGLRDEAGVCELLDAAALARVYSRVPESRRVIAYCTTGTRASVSYLMLRSLNRDVALYDGSWKEWSADASLPIATGAGPDSLTWTHTDGQR